MTSSRYVPGPWNTLACWNVSKLSRTGFPPIADAYAAGVADVDGGVEEVTAVILQQTLFGPETAAAKLVRFNSAENAAAWDVAFASEDRRAAHAKKMASKVQRPANQLAAFGNVLATCTVQHIEC